jgi:hypothetical protein
VELERVRCPSTDLDESMGLEKNNLKKAARMSNA